MWARALAAVLLGLALAARADAVCGDLALDVGEQCDDGNAEGGDCCDAACRVEPAGAPCDDGNICSTGDGCDGAGRCTAGGRRSCDDRNPCTIDSCGAPNGCSSVAVGFPDATAEYATRLATGDCAGQRVRGALNGRFTSAGRLVRQAVDRSPRQARRLVAAAVTHLKKGSGVVARTKHGLTPACLSALRKRYNDARSRTQCLLRQLEAAVGQ
jgi:cysteine-rich repeat protein